MADAHDEPVPAAAVVDFARVGRRLRRSLTFVVVGALVSWPVFGVARGVGLSLRLLGELAGWAALAAFVIELVIVGGAAMRGLIRAGARGDRLARGDVTLVPPQLLRRRR
ncbi:MAG: hypothetical protein WD011_04915 [Nitriliruptoraceae bacterium]